MVGSSKEGCPMTPEDERENLAEAEDLATVDEAVAQEQAHEERRDAHAKQGNIEKETRRHRLDEG